MNFPQSKLDFGSSTNLLSSQVSHSSPGNQFYQSQTSKTSFYNSSVSQNSMRQLFQGIGNLS